MLMLILPMVFSFCYWMDFCYFFIGVLSPVCECVYLRVCKCDQNTMCCRRAASHFFATNLTHDKIYSFEQMPPILFDFFCVFFFIFGNFISYSLFRLPLNIFDTQLLIVSIEHHPLCIQQQYLLFAVFLMSECAVATDTRTHDSSNIISWLLVCKISSDNNHKLCSMFVAVKRVCVCVCGAGCVSVLYDCITPILFVLFRRASTGSIVLVVEWNHRVEWRWRGYYERDHHYCDLIPFKSKNFHIQLYVSPVDVNHLGEFGEFCSLLHCMPPADPPISPKARACIRMLRAFDRLPYSRNR